MANTAVDHRLQEVFETEQRDGLRLALKGRLVLCLVFAGWVAATRPEPLMYYTVAGFAAFGLLGAIQLWALGLPGGQGWSLYGFVILDVLTLTLLIVGFSAQVIADLPSPMTYRFPTVLYFFLFLAAAAFSYSPALVLCAGLTSALAWALGIGWVMMSTETLTYTDIPEARTTEDVLAVVLDPQFIGLASRVQECLVLAAVAVLLAIVMARARRIVYRHAAAELERERITRAFGKYVPEAVASALIDDRGILAPRLRVATVLFADIEGYTTLTERMAPPDVVAMVNEYFDATAEIIGRNGGVINQFQGDAVLATFNLPVSDPEHAQAAIRAAAELIAMGQRRAFRGVTLRARIGINSGEMVAGSVGSAGRLSYTVYGDAVNLAARLEVLNKDYGTRVLISENTARLAGDFSGLHQVGRVAVRGRSQPVTLYSIADRPAVTGEGRA